MISPNNSIVAAPVREALRKLEQENLLQVKPGIGMVISNVDIDLLQQELEIRKMLENHSIQKACEGITEEELKKLEWATDKLQQAINKNSRIAASVQILNFTAYYIPTREIPFSKDYRFIMAFFSNFLFIGP
ncbi:hypothetical protein ACIQYG_19995 [Peribacillus sp. NPDC096622]|uniref:hypothetical protein n=1 Tax=unclassified Peribacillus TaxID=2675266 RepID=UPI003826C1C5